MTTEASQFTVAGSQSEADQGPEGVHAAARIIEVDESASGRALVLFPSVGLRTQLLVCSSQPADRLGLDVGSAPQHPHIQNLTIIVPDGVMNLTEAQSAVCKPLDAHVAVGYMRAKVAVVTDDRSVTGYSVQIDLSDGPLVMVYVDRADRFSTHAAPNGERIAVWVPRGTFGKRN